MRRRATRSVDRTEKETRIIESAAVLLDRGEYSDVTVDRIAREAGEAKGTIYLYFRTREDLFIALLERDLAAWHRELVTLLGPGRGEGGAAQPDLADGVRGRTETGPEEIVARLARSLAARPRMVRLLALSQAILERNVSRERALRYKRFLRGLVATSSDALAARFGWLTRPDAVRFMVYLYALVVGLYFQTEPAPVVRAVIADEAMHEFELDFHDELVEHILVYLAGLRARAAGRREEEA